MNMETLNKP